MPKDEARAIGLWRHLAEQDLSDEAAYSYAMALRTGRGPLEPDPAAAAVLLQRASDRDFGWACHALASQYEFGDGVEQDVDRALELHAKAARLGIVRSYTLLGDVYFQGRGVERDAAKVPATHGGRADWTLTSLSPRRLSTSTAGPPRAGTPLPCTIFSPSSWSASRRRGRRARTPWRPTSG